MIEEIGGNIAIREAGESVAIDWMSIGSESGSPNPWWLTVDQHHMPEEVG